MSRALRKTIQNLRVDCELRYCENGDCSVPYIQNIFLTSYHILKDSIVLCILSFLFNPILHYIFNVRFYDATENAIPLKLTTFCKIFPEAIDFM
jgi:hypothetical protein